MMVMKEVADYIAAIVRKPDTQLAFSYFNLV